MRHVVLGLAVLLASCTAVQTTTTLAPPATTVPPPPQSTTTTTTTEPSAMDLTLAGIQELMDLTEELRGLAFLAEPTITVLSPAGLADRMREDVAEELDEEELARDQEALRILGVVDDELDLGEFYTELLAEQVAGFYDSETKEMVIAVSPDGLSEYDKLIIVHELTHALTDQHFEFGPLSDELYDAEEFDAHAALSGLLEGDASYVEGLYLQALPRDALLDILSDFDGLQSPIFDTAPYFLQESLVAPYVEGLAFVTSRYSEGRWSAVDLAYRTPPVTTEQLLHPDKYLDGEPAREVALTGDFPDTYSVGELSTWGESGLRALLGDVLLPTALDEAVVGWGGDRYRVLWDGERAIFQLQFIGDTPTDSDEFAAGFAEYLAASVPADVRWWLLRSVDEVAVVVASDPADGVVLVKSLMNEGFG